MDGLESTQHLITNVLVETDGDAALATANVVGVHRLTNPRGSPLWTIGGTYDFGLCGWAVSGAFARGIMWVDGNQQVFRAAMRAA